MTANMGCRLLGNLIMPKFADSTVSLSSRGFRQPPFLIESVRLALTVWCAQSRKLAMQISTLGSAIAYFVSGAAQWATGRDGFWVLMAGRVLGGLFGTPSQPARSLSSEGRCCHLLCVALSLSHTLPHLPH